VTFVVRVRGRGILFGKCVENGGRKNKKKKAGRQFKKGNEGRRKVTGKVKGEWKGAKSCRTKFL
jgi:hypothetical protein